MDVPSFGATPVGPGWNCLLAGPGAAEVYGAVRARVGPGAQVVVIDDSAPPAGAQFDFVWVRESGADLIPLAACLWSGGIMLVDDPAADAASLAVALRAVDLEVTRSGPGAAQGRRPQGIYNMW